jgi:hypothetical protein
MTVSGLTMTNADRLPLHNREDAVTDLEVELDFGRGVSGAVETEILHAPALDSREAHITTSTKTDLLKQGTCSVVISRATGLRLTVI